MNKIKKSVEFILVMENIRTKEEFKNWCGWRGVDKLYSYVQKMAPEEWASINTPKESVRYYYQIKLTGYKICHNV